VSARRALEIDTAFIIQDDGHTAIAVYDPTTQALTIRPATGGFDVHLLLDDCEILDLIQFLTDLNIECHEEDEE
jgi:hypothetical protein